MANTYTAYGLALISEMPLLELPSCAETIPNSFEIVHVHVETGKRRAVESLPLVFVSQLLTPYGVPLVHIYRDGPGLLLCYAGIADFWVCPGSVTVIPAESSDPAQVRLFLLGPALAVELELMGIPCLHASAVVLEEGAVGFLAASTGGKSVLASSFVDRGGILLTDDILPLRQWGDRFVGGPGYPQMKIWPEAAQELLGDDWMLDRLAAGLDKRRLPVGEQWGTFCAMPQPLLVLYVPARVEATDRPQDGAKIEIAPISASSALIELVRHMFCARVVRYLGWQSRHLDSLAALVECVPMRSLRYPSGFEYLPAVHAAVSRDLARLGMS